MLYTLEDRKRAVDYCLMRRLLRPAGFWGILFGALAMIIGFAGAQVNPINYVLAMIGAAMLAQGIVICISPSPAMLLAEGIEFWVLAGWNIFVLASNSAAGAGSQAGPFPIIVVVQIFCGANYLRKYRRLQGLADSEPDRQDLHDTEELVKDTLKGNVKRDGDAVSFQTLNKVWKGKILGDTILLVEARGRDFLLAARSELQFDPQGKVLVGKAMKAAMSAGEYTWSAQMDPVSFERLEAWKYPIPPQALAS